LYSMSSTKNIYFFFGFAAGVAGCFGLGVVGGTTLTPEPADGAPGLPGRAPALFASSCRGCRARGISEASDKNQ
jgi:hypothetical protein